MRRRSKPGGSNRSAPNTPLERLALGRLATAAGRLRRAGQIVFVGHMLHPVDHLAVLGFLDGDVGHGGGGRDPVPVTMAERCVCQAVRAPVSKVTRAAPCRAGSGAVLSGSMRTEPVNHSAGPFCKGRVPVEIRL